MPQNRDINIRVKVQDDGSVTLQTIGDKGKKALEEIDRQGQKTTETMRSMEGMVAKVAAAFAGYQAGTWIKDTALLAARYETLGVAMTVVGKNAGYTGIQMENLAKGLQSTGISMTESRSAMTRLAQAHIDLSQAAGLARIAQDAAVVGGINSSEALSTMIHGIQSAQVEVLRTIGINANFEDSYKKLAAQLGKNAKDLSENEKMTARLNVVMEAGRGLAGTYEAAMGTAGKQITSLTRYYEDFRVKMGEAFGPATSTLVMALTSEMKKLEEEVSTPETQATLQKMADSFASLGKSGIEMLGYAPEALSFVDNWGKQLLTIVGALKAAELAQAAYNATALRNPYVIAATAGIAISQQIRKVQGDTTGTYKDGQLDWAGVPMARAELSNGHSTATDYAQLEDERILNMQAQKAAARRAGIKAVEDEAEAEKKAAEEGKKAAGEAKKAAEDHVKYLDQITAKYLPLKTETENVEKAHQGLAEQLAKGSISGAEFAVAMDNLYSSQTSVVESTKVYEERLKELPRLYADAVAESDRLGKSIDSYVGGAASDEEQANVRIAASYNEVVAAIVRRNEVGTYSDDEAMARLSQVDAAHEKYLTAIKGKHEKTTDETAKLWDHAYEQMTDGLADWLATGENGLAGLEKTFEKSIAQMVATWAMGQAKMVWSGGSMTAEQKQQAGALGVYGGMTTGANSMLGLSSVGLSSINELLNPGSYMGSLTSVQSSLAGGAYSMGAQGLGDSIWSMGSNTFGALTAGAGTFVVDLLSGKDFVQSVSEGLGAGGGFMAGMAITGGNPIGGMIGAALGSLGIGSLFGGGDSWVSGRGDVSRDSASFRDWGGSSNMAAVGNPVMDAMDTSITTWLNSFSPALAARIKDKFNEDWGTRSFNSGHEDNWETIASDFSSWMSTNVTQAMNQAMLEAIGTDYLSSDAVSALASKIKAGTDVSEYFKTIVGITGEIDDALSKSGLSQYELGIKAINDQFDAYALQLKALGFDLTKYTALEEARAKALAEQAKNLPVINLTGEGGLKDRATVAANDAQVLTGYITDVMDGYKTTGSFDWGPDGKFTEMVNLADKFQGTTENQFKPSSDTEQLRAAINQFNESSWSTQVITEDNYKEFIGSVPVLQSLSESLKVLENDNVAVGHTASISYLSGSIDTALKNISTQMAPVIKDVMAPVSDVITAHTGTEISRSFDAIAKWEDDQIKNAAELKDSMSSTDYTQWMADITAAADYQTKDLIDKFITPVTDSWKQFFDSINTSALSPAQSKEAMDYRYNQMSLAATDGQGNDIQDSADLRSFVTSSYLPFYQKYDEGNYADTQAKIVEQLKTLSTLMVNGLKNEAGQTITSAPRPVLLEGQEVTLQVNIGGESLGTVVAKQIGRHPAVQAAVRQAVRA